MNKIFVELRDIPYLKFTPSSIGIFVEDNHQFLVDKVIKILGRNGYYKCNLLIETIKWFKYGDYEN